MYNVHVHGLILMLLFYTSLQRSVLVMYYMYINWWTVLLYGYGHVHVACVHVCATCVHVEVVCTWICQLNTCKIKFNYNQKFNTPRIIKQIPHLLPLKGSVVITGTNTCTCTCILHVHYSDYTMYIWMYTPGQVVMCFHWSVI